MPKPTFEEFKRLCTLDQVAHIDITQAPSYQKWYRASLMSARAKDRKSYIYDGWHEKRWLEDRKDLTKLGFDLAFNGGKTHEYAWATVNELGLHPRVNKGIFKGTDWPVEELYERLPE